MRQLSVVFIILTLALGSGCNPHHDKDVIRLNTSRAQLKTIDLALQLANAEAKSKNLSNTVEELVLRVATEKGFNCFRTEIDGKQWLRICPDPKKWHAPTAFMDDIAIYNPISLYDKSIQSNAIVAITFAGEVVSLQRTPAWTPLPIWDLAKNPNVKTSGP